MSGDVTVISTKLVLRFNLIPLITLPVHDVNINIFITQNLLVFCKCVVQQLFFYEWLWFTISGCPRVLRLENFRPRTSST